MYASNKLISVIIPCYNAEIYIAKCLDSVLSQTYDNLQIIVVNDGSTDRTSELLSCYTSDKRVKVITQQNSGVSAARNKGISEAAGEYLAFVDSDDYIEPTMYERLYIAMRDENADMAVCNFNLVYNNKIDEKYSRINNEAVNIYDDVYAYFCKYCACPKPNNYIWTRLYKIEIIKNSGVKFEDFKIAEDSLVNFKLLPLLKRVVFINDGLYNYLQREDSTVRAIANKLNLADMYADMFDSLADYYKANDFKSFLEILSIYAFTRIRSVYFFSRLAGIDDKEIENNIIKGFNNRKIAAYLTGDIT